MGGYHNHSHIRNCNNIEVCIMLGLPYIQGVTYSKYLVGGGGVGGGQGGGKEEGVQFCTASMAKKLTL